jgi:hypothetical protein
MADKSNPKLQLIESKLFILIMGTILTCFVVPPLTEYYNKDRIRRESKLKLQLEIADNASLTNAHINKILTRLEMFHKDNIRLKPGKKELKNVQNKLQEEINQMYLSFDNSSWWWCQNLYQEALILKVTTQDTLANLQTEIDKYQDNVIKTTGILSELWHECISSKYDFRPHSYATELVDSTRPKIKKLIDERGIILTRLISFFNQE